MIVGHRLVVFCSDLDATRTFYAARLGWDVDLDEAGDLVARQGGVELVLEGGARPRRRSRHWAEEAGVLVALRTDRFDELVARLDEQGVDLLGGIVETHDGKRVTGFADPDGNLFEITEA